MTCVAITRCGRGSFWRFETPREASLHPLIQYGDPVVIGPDYLLDEYYIRELPALARLAGANELAVYLEETIAGLAAQGRTDRLISRGLQVEEAHARVWDAMLRVSQEPSDDAATIFDLIREDRAWDEEFRKRRNTSMAEAKKEKTPKADKPKAEKTVGGHPLTTKLTFGSRKVEDKDVSYGPDEKNNPKRGGAAERFKLYKKGITIAAAIEAGMTSGNVAHDLEKGYVVVQK